MYVLFPAAAKDSGKGMRRGREAQSETLSKEEKQAAESRWSSLEVGIDFTPAAGVELLNDQHIGVSTTHPGVMQQPCYYHDDDSIAFLGGDRGD
jgi:hypothetical protein